MDINEAMAQAISQVMQESAEDDAYWDQFNQFRGKVSGNPDINVILQQLAHDEAFASYVLGTADALLDDF